MRIATEVPRRSGQPPGLLPAKRGTISATTRHTNVQIERAITRFEQWAQTLNPEELEDISDLRAIAEATDAVNAANVRLREAVEVARKLHSRSWSQIALPLGVSRQAASERWAEKS